MLLSLFLLHQRDSLHPLKSKKEEKNLETEIKKVGYEMGNGKWEWEGPQLTAYIPSQHNPTYVSRYGVRT